MPLATKSYLTKARFVTGRACPLRLWLSVNDKQPKALNVPGSPSDIGTKIGKKARTLFENGILVKSLSHIDAITQTSELINKKSTEVIFEAALEFQSVRIRIDILERLPGDKWRIIEVKSSTSMQEHHIDDLAVQYFVAHGCGLNVASAQLMHPAKDYTRGIGKVDWPSYFTAEEKLTEVNILQASVGEAIIEQLNVLEQVNPPEVVPIKSKELCQKFASCDYWAKCTKEMPLYWVHRLNRIGSKKAKDFTSRGIYTVLDLLDEDVIALKPKQLNQYRALISGNSYVSSNLWKEIESFGPPAHYLDFEFTNCTIPLHCNMQTNELIAFQWSCHYVDSLDELMALSVRECMTLGPNDRSKYHHEFLANEDGDPSRACSEALLASLGNDDYPILVYNQSAEKRAIQSLANRVPRLAKPLLALLPRLRDLYPLVEQNTFLLEYFKKPLSLDAGTFSIKNTAPAFDIDFDYDNLQGISKGAAAGDSYYRLLTGELMSGESYESLRDSLLNYCKYDTTAMIVLHKGLLNLVSVARSN
jgi:CRISPR/Cas system-associated exonuclease Cas4 (RecB family)